MAIVGRRLYLTEMRDRVVEETDPEAYYLYAGAVDDVPDAEIRRYGIVPGPPPEVIEDAAAEGTQNEGAAGDDGAAEAEATPRRGRRRQAE